MDKKLTLRYDKIGDILYIDTCPPYPAQASEELDGDIITRLNPASGNVENLEILFFSQRSEPPESAGASYSRCFSLWDNLGNCMQCLPMSPLKPDKIQIRASIDQSTIC